jgi:hypothetical protein
MVFDREVRLTRSSAFSLLLFHWRAIIILVDVPISSDLILASALSTASDIGTGKCSALTYVSVTFT